MRQQPVLARKEPAGTHTLLAVLVAFLTALHAHAQPASLAVQGASSGGVQSGAGVRVEATVGGLAGIASVGATTLKQGFAAQLTEAKALLVSAPTTNVNETATLQLQAAAQLDDDSYLALTGTDLLWSAASGPVTINASGLVAPVPVFQDMPASVRGAWRGLESIFGLLVRNNDPDNFPTAPYNFARDGLPDEWQLAFFPAGDAGAAPFADGDGDGLVSLAEYLFNTSPVNAASGPEARPTARLVRDGGQDYVALTVRVRSSYLATVGYQVQAAATLGLSGTVWTNTPLLSLATAPDAQGMVTQTWRDTLPVAGTPRRFLRLQLSLQP